MSSLHLWWVHIQLWCVHSQFYDHICPDIRYICPQALCTESIHVVISRKYTTTLLRNFMFRIFFHIYLYFYSLVTCSFHCTHAAFCNTMGTETTTRPTIISLDTLPSHKTGHYSFGRSVNCEIINSVSGCSVQIHQHQTVYGVFFFFFWRGGDIA